MLVADTAAVHIYITHADNTRYVLYNMSAQHTHTHTRTQTAPTEIYNELKLYTLHWAHVKLYIYVLPFTVRTRISAYVFYVIGNKYAAVFIHTYILYIIDS